ncbi:MAG: hypothetical protein VX130_00680 [Verrucomicrobiota bacterium]|nr:hypothetical protein [Verrucomicrobiota bacterium]
MLHKIFQWWYLRNRSSYGKTYRKIDNRSKERDLIHYFHDFGDDGMNSRNSHWLLKRMLRVVGWLIFLAIAVWFSYESYHGLLIYDN